MPAVNTFKPDITRVPLPEVPALEPQSVPLAKTLGGWTRSLIKNTVGYPASVYGKALATHPAVGTAAGAVGAGLAGLGAVSLYDYLYPDNNENPLDKEKRTLLSVGGTALLGGLGSYLLSKGITGQSKKASFLDSNVDAAILNKLSQDFTLSHIAKQQLASNISSMSKSDKSGLLDLLSGVTGAGIGLVIARYLLKLGFTGQLLLTLAGGFLGSTLGGNGLASKDRDVYGRKYYF
jgi:hypothetical protein